MARLSTIVFALLILVLTAQIHETVGRSCGCPRTSACHDNCCERGYQAGRCMGFLGFSCACLRGRHWISMANQC